MVDTILMNGRTATLDAARPQVSAVAVEDLIPLPAPPNLVGAFRIVAMIVGFVATDRVLTPGRHPYIINLLKGEEPWETPNSNC